MFGRKSFHALIVAAGLLGAHSALAETTLRIAMTATDIPTTTGMPNNGFEGLRFLGYPIFEGLVLWDLSTTDKLAPLRPGLAEKWEEDPNDSKTWIFHLRHGVKFHDGTDFNRRRGDLEFRSLLRQQEPAIRAGKRRHHPGTRAVARQI